MLSEFIFFSYNVAFFPRVVSEAVGDQEELDEHGACIVHTSESDSSRAMTSVIMKDKHASGRIVILSSTCFLVSNFRIDKLS